MKEILGKCTTKSSTIPTKITVNKTDIFDTKKMRFRILELRNRVTKPSYEK